MDSTADSALDNWFEGPLGVRVLREEAALATLALDKVFGFELLQVGAWGPARHLLSGARTQHTTLLAPELSAGVTLCAPLDTLPFRSDSILGLLHPAADVPGVERLKELGIEFRRFSLDDQRP